MTQAADRVFISIAVSRPGGGLDELPGAIKAAERMAAWGKAQGYATVLVHDRNHAEVTIDLLRDEIAKAIKAVTDQAELKRLVVFFAGHGAALAVGDQYWILTHWQKRPSEAIKISSLQRMLEYYGPRQVAIIGDACQEFSAKFVDIVGSPVLDMPNEEQRPYELDQFFAVDVGKQAFMIKAGGGQEDFCLFTEVLLDALEGDAPYASYEQIGSDRAVTSQSLALYLDGNVALEAGKYGVRMVPRPRPGFYTDRVYLRMPPPVAATPPVPARGQQCVDTMPQTECGDGNAQQQLNLNLVVKADVWGSAEVLQHALTALSNEQVQISVILSGVGDITDSDANAAAIAKATIIGFNVRADASARRIIKKNKLDLRYFSNIDDVIHQVSQVASSLLGVEIREEIIGIAGVRDVFRSAKFGAVAGCTVVEGVVKLANPIRVLRDNTVVFEGEMALLRRFKESVDEVRNGAECSIAVKAYYDVQHGDMIECFERVEVHRTLATRSVARVRLAVPASAPSELAAQTQVIQKAREAQRDAFADEVGRAVVRDHFETGCGVCVSGLDVVDVEASLGKVSPVDGQPNWFRIRLGDDGNPLGWSDTLVTLANGRVYAVCVIQGFIAALHVLGDAALSLFHRPIGADEYEGKMAIDLLARAHADLLSRQEIIDTAAFLRYGKHRIITLGCIAAQFYDTIRDVDSLRSMASFYAQHQQPVPLDIVLYGGGRILEFEGRLYANIPAVPARRPRTPQEGAQGFTFEATPGFEKHPIAGRVPWMRHAWGAVATANCDASAAPWRRQALAVMTHLAPGAFTSVFADGRQPLMELCGVETRLLASRSLIPP